MSFIKKRLGPRILPVYLLGLLLVVYAEPTPAGLVLGMGLVVLGEGLRVWATGYLFKNDALTVAGPYQFLRHPLYLGSLLIASGFALMSRNPITLGVFGVFVVFFLGYYMPYKNRIESARLESLYGDPFRRYRTAVPSLLPRVHAYRPLSADASDPGAWQQERFSDNNELGTAVVVGLGAFAMVLRWGLG